MKKSLIYLLKSIMNINITKIKLTQVILIARYQFIYLGQRIDLLTIVAAVILADRIFSKYNKKKS